MQLHNPCIIINTNEGENEEVAEVLKFVLLSLTLCHPIGLT